MVPPLRPPKPAHIPPANWDPKVWYLTEPLYQGLPQELVDLIRSKQPPPRHQKNDKVEIRIVQDPAHPAYGQRGLYAARKIDKGQLISWYTGHLHLDPEPDPDLSIMRDKSDYDLTLVSRLSSLLPLSDPADPRPVRPWEHLGLAVDASQAGSEARFFNDYRGVPPPAPAAKGPSSKVGGGGGGKKASAPKSKPNAFFHSMRTTTLSVPPVLNPDIEREKRASVGELRMGVFALENISKGEEILISYGKGFWRTRMGGDDAAG